MECAVGRHGGRPLERGLVTRHHGVGAGLGGADMEVGNAHGTSRPRQSRPPVSTRRVGIGVFTAALGCAVIAAGCGVGVPTAAPPAHDRADGPARTDGASDGVSARVVGAPAGATGPTGPTGSPGRTGTRGRDGVPGPVGAAGFAGRGGSDGAVGPEGPSGPAGVPGATGATGTAGADGRDGRDGIDGALGPLGPVGPQGPVGPTGVPGADGTDGAAGRDGRDGRDGVDGASGPTGATGVTGATGTSGTNAFRAVAQVSTLAALGTTTFTVACPAGEIAVGGAWDVGGSLLRVQGSGPSASGTAWVLRLQSSETSAREITVRAICLAGTWLS